LGFLSRAHAVSPELSAAMILLYGDLGFRCILKTGGVRVANTKGKAAFAPVLQLKLRGPGVRRGRITVPDLIRICGEAQNVINKQAEVMKGKKTIHPGPTSGAIQDECTLELVGIGDGSTILKFDLAKPQLQFHFREHFGAKVLAEVAMTIQSLNRHKMEPMDPGLLLSLYGLSSLVEQRHQEHTLDHAPNQRLQTYLSSDHQKCARKNCLATEPSAKGHGAG